MNRKMWAIKIVASLAIAALVAMQLLNIIPQLLSAVLALAVLAITFTLEYFLNRKDIKNLDDISQRKKIQEGQVERSDYRHYDLQKKHKK